MGSPETTRLILPFSINIEDDNRQFIVHAKRYRRRIHHLQLSVQDLDVAEFFKFLRAFMLKWIGIIDAFDFGRFEMTSAPTSMARRLAVVSVVK